MKFFSLFKKTKKIENLPDLVKKLDKNQISKYESVLSSEDKEKDPLYMRINVKEIDYINQFYKELPFFKKYLTYPLLKFLSNFPYLGNFLRYKRIIYRPNVDLREPHFDSFPKKYKMSFVIRLFYVCFFCFLIGYMWARLKYDIFYRRYMYCYCFSWMMLFEYLDYKAGIVLDILNEYMPLELSGNEYEFLLYKKIRGYFTKRKLNNQVKRVKETDPELLEIDEILRRINK
jgi:hypothetical protein